MTSEAAYWDSQADTFDDSADHGLRDSRVRDAWRRLLLAHLPQAPAAIADIGCGTGSLSVLLAGEGLHPSSKGARVRFDGDRRTVVDGPFAEAKELIGGWAILEAKDMDEALEVTKRFLSVAGAGESRIRPIFE